MIPLMDKGSLQFITSVMVLNQQVEGVGGDDVNTLLDEADSHLRRSGSLHQPKRPTTTRRISLYTTEVMKKIRELRGISYPL